MTSEPSRREFIKQSFGAVCGYLLFEALFTRDLFAKPIRPLTQHWAKALHAMCLDLRSHALTLAQWQEHIETLLNQIELAELLRFIEAVRQFAARAQAQHGRGVEEIRQRDASLKLNKCPRPRSILRVFVRL